MTPDELHELVHRDPVAAWPHVADLIDAGPDHAHLLLLEDVIYSEQLPQLIEAIELRAAQSRRFREALLWCGDALGGKGGPEMERIFRIIEDAERELATVIEFDDESELHRPVNVLRGMLPGKRVIFKRRQVPPTD